MNLCLIESCNRETKQILCDKHTWAKKRLEKSFIEWQKAYGDKYSMENYLKTIVNDSIGAGEWVIDIAKSRLSSETE